MKTRNMIYCALFAALIAVGAFIKVPIPLIPFTLQTFFVISAGLILGSRLGALSSLLYLVLGLVGLPIFTAGGGFWYVAKPTFGYIIGFCAGGYIAGKIAEKSRTRSLPVLFLAGIAGIFVIYVIGFFYYYFICNYVINTPIALWPLFVGGVIPTIPGDVVLCVISAYVAKKLRAFSNQTLAAN